MDYRIVVDAGHGRYCYSTQWIKTIRTSWFTRKLNFKEIFEKVSLFAVCRAWHIARGWKSLTRVGINEVLEKHNASTVMLGLKEVWNKIMNQRTEIYYKAT